MSALANRYDEWLSLFANRDEVAAEYADALLARGTGWSEWGEFNAAILRRWSPAGLRYIKTKAWALARAAAGGAADKPTLNEPGQPRRLAECVARWPECESGAYDPRCCRFPKSCSCTAYDEPGGVRGGKQR